MSRFAKVRWGLRAIGYSMFGKIGMPSYIGKPIFIRRTSGLNLGKRVRIYPGMRLELESDTAALVVGENCSIGQNFHCVSYSLPLYIGKDVTISGNVFISNCDHGYQEIGKSVLSQEIVERKTTIGDGCYIGYGAVILAGTVLGRQCIVGANSVVRGTYPDCCVLAGSPAKIIKRYDAKTNRWIRFEEKTEVHT